MHESDYNMLHTEGRWLYSQVAEEDRELWKNSLFKVTEMTSEELGFESRFT